MEVTRGSGACRRLRGTATKSPAARAAGLGLVALGVASGRGRGVGGQPGSQIGRALEVEQGVSQGLELLQRQGLNAGGGGASKWSAAAVEQAQGKGSRLSGTATGFTFLPAPIQKVLGGAGVE